MREVKSTYQHSGAQRVTRMIGLRCTNFFFFCLRIFLGQQDDEVAERRELGGV